MKSWLRSFNIYLLAAGTVIAGGCSSVPRLSANKDYATLSIFMEGRPADSLPVQIGWNKTTIYIEGAVPVLTEEDLGMARLVDNADGSYEVQLTFTDHGEKLLEMNTIGKQGKHLVIFAKYRPKGWKEPEGGAPAAEEKPQPGQPRMIFWLAAPLIPQNGITNGSLRFTPEASHEEAERIVLGLNNMAKARHKVEE
jgi:hypothetical protein